MNDTTQNIYKANEKPHKCPVCNGHGKREMSPNCSDIGDYVRTVIKCTSCNGQGMVEISENEKSGVDINYSSKKA